ncbi:hypothetical protein FJ444_09945 [Aestuariibacter sp. GS-14]|uniref:type VI secretion system-associated protein TagO n=1 Tax=Aestuariibacter sp. GS-14 TaxID=2590670 RepID=UPI00112838C1|nr:type VI secretion system-associated protein TagO [Aestuariibacter sp. GS-14]TPV58354.1 hypothetical protein FJ444_09945 [Aestuariibacter sp. GS-14]
MKLRINLVLPALSFLIIAPSLQADTLQQSLAACRAIENGVERLACYDAINANELANKRPMPQRMDKTITEIVEEKQQSAQSQAESQPQPRASDIAAAPSSKPAPQSQFGLKVKSEVQALENITDTVANVTKSARGKMVIHMKSGAIWQQVDSGYFKLEEGMAVYIERGSLGSFFLSNNDVNRRIKVKRIQ